jgi:hypothetical protein
VVVEAQTGSGCGDGLLGAALGGLGAGGGDGLGLLDAVFGLFGGLADGRSGGLGVSDLRLGGPGGLLDGLLGLSDRGGAGDLGDVGLGAGGLGVLFGDLGAGFGVGEAGADRAGVGGGQLVADLPGEVGDGGECGGELAAEIAGERKKDLAGDRP